LLTFQNSTKKKVDNLTNSLAKKAALICAEQQYTWT